MEKFRKKYTFIGNVDSFTKENDEFCFSTTQKTILIKFLSEKVFRIRMNDLNNSPNEFSWSVIKPNWDEVACKVEERKDQILISTTKLFLTIEKLPFRLIVKNEENTIIWEDSSPSGIGWCDNEVIYMKKLPNNEHYYGFGEKTGGLDKRGYRYRMYTRETPFYQLKTDPLYQAHPYFIGLRENIAYGIFFDNTWETYFDMGKKFKDEYIIGAKNGDLNLYFFYGSTIKEVIKEYTELIGRIMLPPIWSLGFQQCRWGYKDAKKVNDIASKIRKHEIPCDVIVLDIDYMNGYRVFTWDENKFPNPKEFIRNLNEKGFHIYAIIDPGVKIDDDYFMYQEGIKNDFFIKKKEGKYWHGYVWPGKTYFPDYTKEEVRNWWGNKLKFLLDFGISGIWNDMNEPSFNIQPYIHRVSTKNLIFYDNGLNTPYEKNHNVYGLLMARATHEGLLKHQPNKRPWILSRSGFPGIHRYAAVWTGDNTSNWQHMAMSIPMLLNMGLSSIPNVGADIGGFHFWINCLRKIIMKLDKKFITRWHQLGVFYPFCRNHTIFLSKDQEPWQFGEEALDIMKKYIKLRYRWMPYFYNLFVECSENGLPPMRPLLLEFQDDEACHEIEDEFLWGDSILIAPVVKKNLKLQEIYIPEGTWFNYWTGKKYQGKKTIKLNTDWHEIPIFIRAGAIIPCQPDMEFQGEKELNPLILEIYPDSNIKSTYEFQEDDGETLDYLKGIYSTTRYSLSCENEADSFIINARKGNFKPGTRDYLIIFKFYKKPKKVELNNKEIIESKDVKLNAWYFDANMNDILIKINDTGEEQLIKLFYNDA
ncbi:MAG: glycoside hydrolase family 31 protein [Candidatus Helarchaeota archaeon]